MIGDLDQALITLEQAVLPYVPGCLFFFGDAEERTRQKTPPTITWYVQAGEPQPPRQIRTTRSFAMVDDMVVIVARCVGMPQPAGEMRRRQFEASRQVFMALALVAHQIHQGYFEDRGWRTVGLELTSESQVVIDYTFAIRAGRWTPPVPDVQPDEQDPNIEVLTS